MIGRAAVFILGLSTGVLLGALASLRPADAGYCEYPPHLSIEYAHCIGDAEPAGEGWVYRGVVAPGYRFYARYPEHGD